MIRDFGYGCFDQNGDVLTCYRWSNSRSDEV